MKTYRLSARVDEETWGRLERRARVEDKDESQIVREALAAHLSMDKETAYEALKRIGGIGTAKGLPSDLSTSKKYFEGFGSDARTRSSRHRTTRRAARAR